MHSNIIILQAKLRLSEDKLQQVHSNHQEVLEVSDRREELEVWDPGKLLVVPDTDTKFKKSDA